MSKVRINFDFEESDLDKLNKIKEHYGLTTRTSTLRFIINKQSKELE